MVDHDQLARWFGESNLIRLSDEAREKSPLPEDARAALSELGLPYVVDPYPNPWFTSGLAPNGSDMVVFDWPRRQSKLCRIGSNAGDPQMPICVDGKTGEVVQVSFTGDGPECFVNSNLRAFIESLYAVSRHRARYRGCSEAQALAVLPDLERQLRRIDPRALEDPDHWWSLLIEEMHQLMF